MKITKAQVKAALRIFKSKDKSYLPGSPKAIYKENFQGEGNESPKTHG